MENRNIWVYDIETLKSCFTYTAINIDTEEIVQYVIHNDKNDIKEFISHLLTCKGQIGFNNINFDYPIIHNILINKDTLVYLSAKEIIELLYNKAQDIIEKQNNNTGFNAIVAIPYKEVLIPQLDLFKLWHFNNKARSTSLKALQISIKYPNVMEMPISHTRDDIKIDDVEGILSYNLNDVLSTYEFYKKSLDKIDLRIALNKKYDLHCLNFPDTKIGEQLTLKLYCEATKQNPWEVKKLRTIRDKYPLKDIVFPYIKFNSKEFNEFLESLKSTVIYNTKGEFQHSVIYKGFKYDFGAGGIHGCIKSGLYESNEDWVILDADVGSMYPNIAIVNELYPEHLGVEFCKVYEEGIVLPRLKAKKEGDSVMADGFKLSANSVYGKSNDQHSFLQDGYYTLRTTINGQLMLAGLGESLADNIEDLKILQINTDGITVLIRRTDIDKYYELCKDWEKYTKLSLEYVEYSKMWIGDVNNYGCVSTSGKIKNKGRFEVDKDYHKDNSFRVIPLALQEYFINNTPIEQTILNHKDIYDFCGRQKFRKGESYGIIHYLNNDNVSIEEQQRNVRYYISNKGATFIKMYNKGTSEAINKGYQVTIFNDYIDKPFEEYDLNYNFYIKEANKEINNIENKQYEIMF